MVKSLKELSLTGASEKSINAGDVFRAGARAPTVRRKEGEIISCGPGGAQGVEAGSGNGFDCEGHGVNFEGSGFQERSLLFFAGRVRSGETTNLGIDTEGVRTHPL